jgi:hypothetical protein
MPAYGFIELTRLEQWGGAPRNDRTWKGKSYVTKH